MLRSTSCRLQLDVRECSIGIDMNAISKAVIGVALVVSWSATQADAPFPVYWHDNVPKSCEVIGPVSYSQSFGKDSVEFDTPGDVLQRRFLERCIVLAKEKGGNAFSDEGVSHYHGKKFFGYECKGAALKC